jgi:hypothetical protein
MCSSGRSLALVARGELGKVTVVVTLPVVAVSVTCSHVESHKN